jgi:hypothetical protein
MGHILLRRKEIKYAEFNIRANLEWNDGRSLLLTLPSCDTYLENPVSSLPCAASIRGEEARDSSCSKAIQDGCLTPTFVGLTWTDVISEKSALRMSQGRDKPFNFAAELGIRPSRARKAPKVFRLFLRSGVCESVWRGFPPFSPRRARS